MWLTRFSTLARLTAIRLNSLTNPAPLRRMPSHSHTCPCRLLRAPWHVHVQKVRSRARLAFVLVYSLELFVKATRRLRRVKQPATRTPCEDPSFLLSMATSKHHRERPHSATKACAIHRPSHRPPKSLPHVFPDPLSRRLRIDPPRHLLVTRRPSPPQVDQPRLRDRSGRPKTPLLAPRNWYRSPRARLRPRLRPLR